MTDQINDDGELMRFMDARGSLTELGVASIQAILRKELGAKPS